VRWAPVLAASCSARPDILVFLRNRASVSTRLEAPATVFWMLDNHTDGAALFHDAFHQRGGKIVVASLAFEELLRGAGVAAETVMIRHPIQLNSYPDDSAIVGLPILQCPGSRARALLRPPMVGSGTLC
jgi:hypothetical protein